MKTLKQWRAAHGLSQGKLARLLGCAQASVQRWESGQKQPSGEYVAALAALGYEQEQGQ